MTGSMEKKCKNQEMQKPSYYFQHHLIFVEQMLVK